MAEDERIDTTAIRTVIEHSLEATLASIERLLDSCDQDTLGQLMEDYSAEALTAEDATDTARRFAVLIRTRIRRAKGDRRLVEPNT